VVYWLDVLPIEFAIHKIHSMYWLIIKQHFTYLKLELLWFCTKALEMLSYLTEHCSFTVSSCTIPTGQRIVYQPLEQHIPSAGLQVVYEDGVMCEVTKKPRRTTIDLPCDPDRDVPVTPSRAYEGNKQTICNYYVEFSSSKLFCPSLSRGLVTNTSPVITAGKFAIL